MRKLLIFLFIFLTGCSFKSIVIPNLGFLIADRIDSSLHLYNEQEYQVRDEIKKLLVKERGVVLRTKKYITQVDIKNIDVKKSYAFFASNYYTVAIKVNRILAKQFSTLDRNQVEKLKESMKEENEEIVERTKERRPKDFYKRYSYFFGDLTTQQKNLISKNMELFRELANKRLEERVLTQKALFSILSLKDPIDIEKRVTALFDKNADRSELTPSRLKSIEQFKEFVQSLTSDQEKYFKKKVAFFNEWMDAYLKNY